MKVVAALMVCAVATTAHANIRQVVPTAFENAPGTSTFLGPLANAARTYQLLIHESQLTNLVGLQLTGISWRLPTSATGEWPTGDITYANYDIYLSGSVNPADRSLTFANNVVGPQTQVRSGGLEIAGGSYPSGISPNDFGTTIGFDSAWTYTGGNLLLEIRHTGFSGTSRSVDAIAATGGGPQGYGTLFSAAWTGSYTGLSGSQGNFSIVEFTAIPAPGAAAVLGLGLLAGARRRR